MNKIAIIVVTYNRLDLLKKCIEMAIKQPNIDLIVVNNASTDGTEKYLLKKRNEYKFYYFNTGSNLGGAGGFAFGLKKATELKYDYAFVIDDDTMLQSDTIAMLSKAIKEVNDFSFLACKVLWKDKTLCIMNKPKISKDILKYHKYLQNGIIEVTSSSFVGCLINIKYVLEVGLPISDFFIWCDDVEYTTRLTQKAPGFLVSNALIIHECARNDYASIYRENDINRIKRFKFLYRNRFYNMRKKGFAGLLRYFLLMGRDVLYTLFTGKHKLLKLTIIFKGFILGIFFYPKIEMVEIK